MPVFKKKKKNRCLFSIAVVTNTVQNGRRHKKLVTIVVSMEGRGWLGGRGGRETMYQMPFEIVLNFVPHANISFPNKILSTINKRKRRRERGE